MSAISEKFRGIEPSGFAFPWLVAFTTPAQHGGERLDFMADRCEAQRRELERALAPLAVTWLSLEHGNTVIDLTRQNVPLCPPNPVADGAILTEPGMAVAFTTADCLPIICVSERHRVVAAIHAGWRSLAAGIIEVAVTRLEQEYGVDPTSLRVWIGPAIAFEDYEVSDEVREKLLVRPAVTERFFLQTQPGHWLVDLSGAARAVFASLGVSSDSMERYPISTARSQLLHSARRDGAAAGRMATLAGIK